MMRKERDSYLEEGVSESIGFLLIFTLVIVGIGLVTLYGYPMLLQQQTSADEQIMAKNMIVLQNDVKGLAYKTVPFKETTLKTGTGTLAIYNSSYLPATSVITIYSSAGTHVDSFRSGDLRYSSPVAGSDISLQNGAVVSRRYVEDGSVMLAEPRWFYDWETNTLMINMVNFTSEKMMSRGNSVSTVQMMLGHVNFTKIPVAAGDTIYLDYAADIDLKTDQDYSVAWDNYFRNTMKMSVNGASPYPMIPDTLRTTYRFDMVDLTRDATLVIKDYEIKVKAL